MKLLIIEDKPERIDILSRIYHQQDVSVADNVDTARNSLSNCRYDLIHLDYDLHDKTSSEIARLISPDSLTIIHSENPDGVKVLQEQILGALVVPFHLFVEKSGFMSKLKVALSNEPDIVGIRELFEYENRVVKP